VATDLNNLALALRLKGDYGNAEPLCRQALAMYRKSLGEEHPAVAGSRYNLGGLLHAQGDYGAAVSTWSDAAQSFEGARLRMAPDGLQRVAYGAGRSPLPYLAACLARTGKPLEAWQRLEANLARGLLDALSARDSRPLSREEQQREESLIGQLSKLDEWISALLGTKEITDELQAKAAELRRQRDDLQAEFTRFEADLVAKYGVVAGKVYELERIQAALPADAALLAWVDIKGDPHAVDPNGEHWACVLQSRGAPVWVKLPGSGAGGAWTEDDDSPAQELRDVLSQRSSGESPAWQQLVDRLCAQRLAPVEAHLQGGTAAERTTGIPPVRQLIVLPAGWMAGVPVEALTDQFAVSYAPSGTMYAWLKEKGHKGTEACRHEGLGGLLALGDPVFAKPEEIAKATPELPEHGVLIAMVVPNSNAARSGLKAGDVLLSYAGQELTGADELGPPIQRATADETTRAEAGIPVKIWREGQPLELAVGPGKLGVQASPQPAPEALAAQRRLDVALAATRGSTMAPLPGSRREVEAIAGLFRQVNGEAASTVLLGSDASEQRLDALAVAGELKKFRFLHLATHGVMDDQVAMRSALIWSQDQLPDALEQVLAGKEVYDGRLTADQIVRTWRLDADLVTLSACLTALGKASGGEGYLGFAQALFVAGARSLVLSLWKVDDTATALLMQRFYENLLGQYDSPRGTCAARMPLPKAEALREAKNWLRSLTVNEVMALTAQLPGGADRGTVREKPATEEPSSADHPYAAPYYWAAFILLGDPG